MDSGELWDVVDILDGRAPDAANAHCCLPGYGLCDDELGILRVSRAQKNECWGSVYSLLVWQLLEAETCPLYVTRNVQPLAAGNSSHSRGAVRARSGGCVITLTLPCQSFWEPTALQRGPLGPPGHSGARGEGLGAAAGRSNKGISST